MIFLLHVTLSVCSPAHSPVLFMSRWHATFHLVFDRLLFFFPRICILNTFLSSCSSSFLITCPYQFSRLSVIFLEASCTILVVPRMRSFLVLSLLHVASHVSVGTCASKPYYTSLYDITMSTFSTSYVSKPLSALFPAITTTCIVPCSSLLLPPPLCSMMLHQLSVFSTLIQSGEA